MSTHEPVTFLDSEGNVISNDPIWQAQQLLGLNQPEDEDLPGEYDDLTGAELKALAKERGISITGMKKTSELRAALEAWDAEQSSDDDESGDSGNDQE